MKKLSNLFSVALLTLSFSNLLGCGAEPSPQAPERDTIASIESALSACAPCSNCVCYARNKQPKLPFGLNTYKDKLDIINSSSPARGCVAIIDSGVRSGHVAYVEKVDGLQITISEGNWPAGVCPGPRSGTEGSLRISGYFCP